MRVNKTINNLEKVWIQLDQADGLLNNAIFTLMAMKNFDQEMQDKIERTNDSFDQIVNLKNDIEKLIEEKRNENKLD